VAINELSEAKVYGYGFNLSATLRGSLVAGFLLYSIPAWSGICPNDLAGLPVGHWCAVPNSTLEDISSRDDVDVMDPWSGGAYDTKNHRLIIWGGGHTDYDGNELYAFNVDGQQWEQLTDPTSSTGNGETYADGRPSSRHTYDGLQYLPDHDWLWSSGGSVYSDGDCTSATWIYDFNSARNDGWMRISAGSGGGGCEDSSAYHPVTGHIWFWNGDEIFEFDPDNLTNPWSLRIEEDVSGSHTAAIDPVRDVLVVIGNGAAFKYDISNPNNVTGGALNTTGQNQIENVKAPGLAYDPTNGGRLVAWGGAGSIATTDVFVLDTGANEWHRFVAADDNSTVPAPANSNGTYGRFQYVPSEDVFILVNDTDQSVYFYRMSDSEGSPPSTNQSNDGGGGLDCWLMFFITLLFAGKRNNRQ
jgi:hypothetical protein